MEVEKHQVLEPEQELLGGLSPLTTLGSLLMMVFEHPRFSILIGPNEVHQMSLADESLAITIKLQVMILFFIARIVECLGNTNDQNVD